VKDIQAALGCCSEASLDQFATLSPRAAGLPHPSFSKGSVDI
jgi:hypothetical protein